MAFDYLSRDHAISAAIEALLGLLTPYMGELDGEARLFSLIDCHYDPRSFGAYGKEDNDPTEFEGTGYASATEAV